MLTINIDPVLVHLGPLAISWYGLAVAAAVIVGIWLTMREVRRRGLQEAQLLALGALAVAIVWAIWGRNTRLALSHRQ